MFAQYILSMKIPSAKKHVRRNHSAVPSHRTVSCWQIFPLPNCGFVYCEERNRFRVEVGQTGMGHLHPSDLAHLL